MVSSRVSRNPVLLEIAAGLRAKGDAEMLAEGAQSEDSGRYDLAGDYPTLVDGLMRYVSKRRKSGSLTLSLAL
jgi:hypothetical protein